MDSIVTASGTTAWDNHQYCTVLVQRASSSPRPRSRSRSQGTGLSMMWALAVGLPWAWMWTVLNTPNLEDIAFASCVVSCPIVSYPIISFPSFLFRRFRPLLTSFHSIPSRSHKHEDCCCCPAVRAAFCYLLLALSGCLVCLALVHHFVDLWRGRMRYRTWLK